MYMQGSAMSVTFSYRACNLQSNILPCKQTPPFSSDQNHMQGMPHIYAYVTKNTIYRNIQIK